MQPRRVQGCFISDDEVRAVTTFWRDWLAQQVEQELRLPPDHAPWERGLTRREFLADTDPMLEAAIELVIAEGDASASLIQRRLNIGHPRAARIMDMLLELGLIGELKADRRSREVLVMPGQDPFKAIIDERLQQRRPGADDEDDDEGILGDPEGSPDADDDWLDEDDEDQPGL